MSLDKFHKSVKVLQSMRVSKLKKSFRKSLRLKVRDCPYRKMYVEAVGECLSIYDKPVTFIYC